MNIGKTFLKIDMRRDVRYVITFKSVRIGKMEMKVTEFGYTSINILIYQKAGLKQFKMSAIFTKE